MSASFRCPNCGRTLPRLARRCYACPWRWQLPAFLLPLLLGLLAVLIVLCWRN